MEQEEIITHEKLPLSVREHLMRGNQSEAISLLESDHEFTKESAEKLIEDYREALRERKIELEIQIMNEQNAKMAEEELHLKARWGARIVIIVLFILASFMIIDMIALK